MITRKIILPLVALAMTGITSCTDDTYKDYGEGAGTISIIPEVSSLVPVTPISRADEAPSDADYLLQKLNIVISTARGNAIRYWNSASGIPWNNGAGSSIDFTLNSGTYTIEGWTGDSIAASWTRKYFKGKEVVSLKPDEHTAVQLTCKIVNTAVDVKYSDQIDDVLSHYTLVVSTAATSLNYEGREERTGYFMLPTKSHDMTWVFNGIRKDGTAIHMHGTIEDAKASTKYRFLINYEDPGINYGGGAITIDVDESTLDVEEHVRLRMRPVITRYIEQPDTQEPTHFEIGEANPLPGIKNKIGDICLMARSSGKITGVRLQMGGLPESVPTDIIMYGKDADPDAVSALGISGSLNDNPIRRITNFPITISSKLIDALDDGEFRFTVSVTDENYGLNDAETDRNTKERTETFILNITSEGAIAVKPNEEEKHELARLHYDEILLVGQVVNDETDKVGFYVREQGSGTPWDQAEYIDVDASELQSRAIANGPRFKAVVGGRTIGKTYEYVTSYNQKPGVTVATVTQRSPMTWTLPNAGFEDWQLSTPYLIYGSGQEMFWDSGNHGSSTMKKNVTVPESNIKHSGNYSIKLESQFVGIGSLGKFAAGNVFIGEYLDTKGTNGVLGWGRPFKDTPKQIKGYVKYTPGIVKYTNSGAPDIIEGQPDKGIIYVALLDDDMVTQGDKNYPGYPVVVRTEDAHLFDKNARNVIAYGELIFDKATEGTGLIEFTIDLDYYRRGETPSYIIFTASASKGGDFFAGGPSIMWLDDIQLIY